LKDFLTKTFLVGDEDFTHSLQQQDMFVIVCSTNTFGVTDLVWGTGSIYFQGHKSEHFEVILKR